MGKTPEWWHFESVAGRSLLHVRITDGVGDLGVLERHRRQQELDDEAETEEAGALLDMRAVEDLSDHNSDAN